MTWRRNGVTIASGPHSFGRQLTISAPTSSDTGAYVCEAARRGGASARASAQAFLSIIGNARPGGVAGAEWGGRGRWVGLGRAGSGLGRAGVGPGGSQMVWEPHSCPTLHQLGFLIPQAEMKLICRPHLILFFLFQ